MILFYDLSIIIHLVYLIYDVNLELMYIQSRNTQWIEILSNVCYRLVTQIQLLQANVKLNQIFRHLLSFTFEEKKKLTTTTNDGYDFLQFFLLGRNIFYD